MANEDGAYLPVLSGGPLCPATLFDGKTHFGVAVEVVADGKTSYLMMPDVTGITKGQPVYITKPVTIKGEYLAVYLKKKSGADSIPEKVEKLLNTASISCNAFYFSQDKRKMTPEEFEAVKKVDNKAKETDEIDVGAFLMMFELKAPEGLIGTLVDPDLGKLFDVTGASLRVLRCRDAAKGILEAYAKQLVED
jgi:hypothetical protein